MSAPEASRSEAARPRYAIYFAPDPESLLHSLGSSWLGRDANGSVVQRLPFATRLEGVIEEPRRYGFHATLKPPMTLMHNLSADGLVSAVEAEASRITPFALKLTLSLHHGFLALVPAKPTAELDVLAAHCVEVFDRFRAPPGEQELQRRRAAGLSERQQRNLERWGYPYVFADFAFHMTLSRRLSALEADAIMPLAENHFAPILQTPIPADALTVFVEPSPGADFIIHHRARFGGRSEASAP